MSDAGPPEAPRGLNAQLKRQLKRPHVVLLFMAIGMVLVFPRFGPSEVTVHHALPICATNVSVRAFQGDELVRSSARELRGERSVDQAFLLPKGSYRLEVDVDCQKGGPAHLEETLVHEKADALDFDFRKKCAC